MPTYTPDKPDEVTVIARHAGRECMVTATRTDHGNQLPHWSVKLHTPEGEAPVSPYHGGKDELAGALFRLADRATKAGANR